MIVCHCMRITDSQILEKIRNGLTTVEDLADDCGITMGCGGCRPSVEKIIREETQPNKVKSVYGENHQCSETHTRND